MVCNTEQVQDNNNKKFVCDKSDCIHWYISRKCLDIIYTTSVLAQNKLDRSYLCYKPSDQGVTKRIYQLLRHPVFRSLLDRVMTENFKILINNFLGSPCRRLHSSGITRSMNSEGEVSRLAPELLALIVQDVLIWNKQNLFRTGIHIDT